MPETRLFRKSIDNFKVNYSVQWIYNVAKLGYGIWMLVPTRDGCTYNTFEQYYIDYSLNLWIFWLCIHSLLMMISLANIITFIEKNDKREMIATRLGHQIEQEQQNIAPSFLQDSKDISILTRQIKSEIYKETCIGKWSFRFLGLCYQALFVTGIVILFLDEIRPEGCDNLAFYLLVVVLLLCLYQYIDLYIILVFTIIFSPFLLLFLIAICFKSCQQNEQTEQIRQRLQKFQYKPNSIEGEAECVICRCAYELDEELIVLPCHKLHHFHASCILSWINVNHTCPMCRQPI